MRAPRCHIYRGFTLTELLVSITIVAILAAILIAGLNHAISRARVTKCQGNLRNIGMAWMLYINEHGGEVPKTVGNWYGWGGYDTGHLINNAPPIEIRPLTPYIDSPETFQCPADEAHYAFDEDKPIWQTRGTSYSSNEQIFYTQGVGGVPTHFAQFERPDRTIVIGDATMKFASTANNARSGVSEYYTWHTSPGGGWYSNVVFADGHTELVNITTSVWEEGDTYQWEAK